MNEYDLSESETAELYEQLRRNLEATDASMPAAEVHGVICGLLSVDADLPTGWFAELFDQAEEGDLLVAECRQQINRIYEMTNKQIAGPGLGMTLLLPSEDQPVRQQAKAVTNWCQGFLYGVGIAVSDIGRQLEDEANEVLQDIAQLAQMDIDALEDNEEEQDALIEITEFLWVAAMLVRENLLENGETSSEHH